MTIFLAILGALVIGGSLYADYRWKRWMAARQAERGDGGVDDRR